MRLLVLAERGSRGCTKAKKKGKLTNHINRNNISFVGTL